MAEAATSGLSRLNDQCRRRRSTPAPLGIHHKERTAYHIHSLVRIQIFATPTNHSHLRTEISQTSHCFNAVKSDAVNASCKCRPSCSRDLATPTPRNPARTPAALIQPASFRTRRTRVLTDAVRERNRDETQAHTLTRADRWRIEVTRMRAARSAPSLSNDQACQRKAE